MLRHSLEVAYLTGLMAEEIGLDGALGRRCGLLHDIGKAADHEMEGGHPAVGAELAKRYKLAFIPFLLEGFADKPDYFQADTIHPNAEAQPLIAARVWEELRPLLR